MVRSSLRRAWRGGPGSRWPARRARTGPAAPAGHRSAARTRAVSSIADERLNQVVFGAGVERPPEHLRAVVGEDEDDRQLGERPHLRHQLNASAAGQDQVEEHQRRPLCSIDREAVTGKRAAEGAGSAHPKNGQPAEPAEPSRVRRAHNEVARSPTTGEQATSDRASDVAVAARPDGTSDMIPHVKRPRDARQRRASWCCH